MRIAPLACVLAPDDVFSRVPTPLHCLRRRQQNVDIMLQNLDKTEALENKSADLANQAKTCAASPPRPRPPLVPVTLIAELTWPI